MERLRGRGLGAGMALGTAAVVRKHNGLLLLPEPPLRVLEERAKRRDTEPPDVILVAADYRSAQGAAEALTWGRVVGFAVGETPQEVPVSGLPGVVDISGLPGPVADDMLLLVDAGRGLVLVDPDAMAVARYQAEAEHIAPKRRLFLDDTHLPAHTLDGRTITVIAELSEKAVEAGADALYLTLEVETVVFDEHTPTPEQKLQDALRIAAGKPLIVSYSDAIAPEVYLQAAAQIDLTLSVPIQGNPEAVAHLDARLHTAEAICQERELLYSLPRLAAEFIFRMQTDWPAYPQQDIALVESLIAHGASRPLFFPVLWAEVLKRFEAMATVAASALIPVYVNYGDFTLPNDTPESAAEALIGAGVSGFITYDAMVMRLKEIIRETNATECREALLQRMTENAAGETAQ